MAKQSYIANFVKKIDFDTKLKNVTSNKNQLNGSNISKRINKRFDR